MYNTKYIIYNDIDEIILPKIINNYIQFLNSIDNHSSDIYFSYFSSNYQS